MDYYAMTQTVVIPFGTISLQAPSKIGAAVIHETYLLNCTYTVISKQCKNFKKKRPAVVFFLIILFKGRIIIL